MLEILILAAGKGTRMRSSLPKVLHTLAGKPLLGHVVDTAHALDAARICVVYGFGGEAVPQAMADDKLTFVLQAEQQGTGHAVKQALPQLSDDSVTLVLYGDVPLTHTRTLQPLVTAAQAGKLGLLTVELAQPDGYGASCGTPTTGCGASSSTRTRRLPNGRSRKSTPASLRWRPVISGSGSMR